MYMYVYTVMRLLILIMSCKLQCTCVFDHCKSCAGNNPSQMFNRAKRGLQTITTKSKDATDQERKVAKNVTTSLAISLQDLSVNFRKSQSSYLKRECYSTVCIGIVTYVVFSGSILSITDTLGPKKKLSWLKRCPYFRGSFVYFCIYIRWDSRQCPD